MWCVFGVAFGTHDAHSVLSVAALLVSSASSLRVAYFVVKTTIGELSLLIAPRSRSDYFKVYL